MGLRGTLYYKYAIPAALFYIQNLIENPLKTKAITAASLNGLQEFLSILISGVADRAARRVLYKQFLERRKRQVQARQQLSESEKQNAAATWEENFVENPDVVTPTKALVLKSFDPKKQKVLVVTITGSHLEGADVSTGDSAVQVLDKTIQDGSKIDVTVLVPSTPGSHSLVVKTNAKGENSKAVTFDVPK